MDEEVNKMNELFVEVYDDIQTIEETAIKQGALKDLTIKELHTIDAIGLYGSKIMSELAEAMKVTMGTLTITVDKLIQKGYLERKRSESDRRVVNVLLTKQGKIAYRFHEKFHMEMVKAAVNKFTEEEEKILMQALSKLNLHLKDISTSLQDK